MSANESKSLKLLLPAINTQLDDPFQDDAFQRKPLAENLTRLVSSFANQSFVLGINGSWGSGKTKFLEMWTGHLKSQGYRTLHFNAWENDHADDPFAAVLSEFRQLTEVSEIVQQSKLVAVWKKVAKKSIPILERAAAGAIKNLTLGLLEMKSAEAEAIISDLAQESATQALKRCEESRKSIAAFRAELEHFVKLVDAPDKPVVYMVDELDRCRPTFAIAVLERIKHLLNVPGVVFVFAWDRQQLNGTIRSIYGKQTDPGGYLLRFIDLEMNLPQGDSKSLCKALMIRSGLWHSLHDENLGKMAYHISESLPKFSKVFKLTVREQEKVFTAISISWRVGRTENVFVIDVLIILIMIRLKFPETYISIGDDKTFELLITKDLPNILGPDIWKSSDGGLLEGCFLFTLSPNARESLVQKLRSHLNGLGARLGRTREEDVYDGFVFAQDFGSRKGGIIMALMKQIEFSENFWP